LLKSAEFLIFQVIKMTQAQFIALWNYLDNHYFTELSLDSLDAGLGKIQQSVANQVEFPVLVPNKQEVECSSDSELSGRISFSHHF
jgi:hypothetical protein